jgi:hypothetical protein
VNAPRELFRRNVAVRDAVAYVGVMIVTIAISAIVLDLRHADLAVPFDYSGSDSYTFMQAFKNIQETGSIDVNPRIGAPLHAGFQGDPQILSLPILLARLLFLFLRDFGTALNVYFLLSFPLTAACTLYALRALGFSYFTAVVPAILYTFLPYHILRGESHLLIAAYFLVPLAVLIALWIAGGRPLFPWGVGRRVPSVSNEGALAILVCVLIGTYHPYYAFFALFVFLLAAAYGFVAFGSQSLVDGAATIGITVLAFVTNMAGYVIRNGTALPTAWNRTPTEAEFFGLKFIQLLLPIPAHRIGVLAQFRHNYDTTAPMVYENSMASLGIVGSLGFVLLLFVLLLPFRMKPSDLLKQSAVLAYGCFVLATIGGLGSLFNYVVTPDIRAYNRISVYIAFFSFIAVAWALERGQRRLRSRGARGLSVAGLALLLILGVADQSSPTMVPNYAANAATYRSDDSFARAIEGSLPPRSAVFQLPYTPYPYDRLFPAGISPYWSFKGYLHSNGLRWSYGAIQGSEDDNWIRSLSLLPVATLLPKLVVAGFDGIYIERPAYSDQKAERALESDLSKVLREAPLVSDNRLLAFYSLEPFRKAEIARLSEAGFARAQKLLPPLLMGVVSGCSDTEDSAAHLWRWCGKHAVLAISNLTAVTKRGMLSGTIHGAPGVAGMISLRAGAESGQLRVSSKTEPIHVGLTAPPGTSLLDFEATFPPAATRRGPLYYSFLDLKLFDQTTGDETDFYSY